MTEVPMYTRRERWGVEPVEVVRLTIVGVLGARMLPRTADKVMSDTTKHLGL